MENKLLREKIKELFINSFEIIAEKLYHTVKEHFK